MNLKTTTFAVCILILINSCSPKFNINEYIPSVDFRGVRIDKLEPEINILNSTLKVKINLKLKFRFNNPYDIALTIPDHEFKFKMSGRPIAQLSKSKESFVIPPKSNVIQTYALLLDLDPGAYLHDFMGKDNPYSFESTFHILIKDYVKDKYASSALKYIFKSDHIDVPFEFGDTLRLALPPKIHPTLSEFAHIDFLGRTNEINLSPMGPFVNFLINQTIGIYAPTWEDPFRIRNVNPADLIVEKLTVVDPQADKKWQDFKNKWNDVKNNLKIEYPGPNTSGFKIYIPFDIENPNEFPIETSFITANAVYNNSYSPYIIEFKSADASKMIPGKTKKKYYMSWQTNFFNGNILQMFGNGEALPYTPGIQGKIGMDFGYGIMEIPIDIRVPLKFGNN